MKTFEKIKINVGGQTFVTKKSTLQRYPDTKLCRINETCEYFDKETQEYYYDRNPLIFHSVLDYYRTGKLHFLSNVCAETVREELEYWNISTSNLGPCCWKDFYTIDSNLKTVEVIEHNFFREACSTYQGSKQALENARNKLWKILEQPKSSKLAMVWQLFYIIIVGFAIVSSVLQTFELQRKHEDKIDNSTSSRDVMERLMGHEDWLEVVTHFCNIVFLFETVLRFVACPSKCEFLKSFLNVVDVISVLGYLVYLVVIVSPGTGTQYETFFVFTYVLMILRGFRFFRLERFIEGLRLMLLSIKQCKKMLFLLILVLFITSVIFGIAIHAVEMDGMFSDPIRSFYWAIITMTTVGYGDIYPRTDCGQIVASICATVGVFLLSMPIAVVANTFTDLNNRYKERYSHIYNQNRKRCCYSDKSQLITVKY